MEMDTSILEVKGAIECPVCGKEKFIAYQGAAGSTSVHCKSCGKLIFIDYDKMTACPAKPRKGAYKYARPQVNN